MLPWLSQRSDWNLTENLSVELKRNAKARKPSSLLRLCTWNVIKISVDICTNLVKDYWKRLEKFIAKKRDV